MISSESTVRVTTLGKFVIFICYWIAYILTVLKITIDIYSAIAQLRYIQHLRR